MKYLILMLLVLGCSSPMAPDGSDLHRCYQPINVPDDQLVFIQSAMDEWNTKTNYSSWSLGEGCDSILERVETIPNKDDAIGVTFVWENKRVAYESSVSGEQLRVVISHELGHVAHLLHSDNPEDIMYPSINDVNKHLSENDLRQFNTINWR